MTTVELTEYLGILLDMEKEQETETQLIEKVKIQVDALGIAKEIEAPVRNVPEKPGEPLMGEIKNKKEIYNLTSNLTMVVILGVILLVVGFNMIGYGYGAVALGVSFLGLVIAGGSFRYMQILISEENETEEKNKKILAENSKKQKNYQERLHVYEHEYAQKTNEYENAYKEYKVKVEEENKRLVREEQEKAVLNTTLQQITVRKSKGAKALGKLYDMDVVYPKYRNLSMISSLYEYFASGRCSTLEGHEGAYNILEQEIRLDHIVLRLDQVIVNLEKIRQNQYMLYEAMQSVNANVSRLYGAVLTMNDNIKRGMEAIYERQGEQIDVLCQQGKIQDQQMAELNAQIAELQKTSEVTNYINERNQRELHYMNRMNYLAGNYDNPYGNYAPV